MAMSENQRRKAANEAVFREVNERVEALQHAFAAVEDQPLHIVCECDRLDCTSRVPVHMDVYEATRRDPTRFFVIPGHDDEAVEDIVDTGGDYVIVRKRPGDPQRIAEETDPRA